MPNKTIYVSDSDQKIYQRAQELAGGNLSAAIVAALRRYVDVEEGRGEGFEEIIVRVGAGTGRKVRFTGVLLAQLGVQNSGRYDHYHVYRTRNGKYALHVERSPGWSARDADGKPAGWRGHLGIGNLTYAATVKNSTIDVVATLEELRDKVPSELYDMVASMGEQPVVEDLDI